MSWRDSPPPERFGFQPDEWEHVMSDLQHELGKRFPDFVPPPRIVSRKDLRMIDAVEFRMPKVQPRSSEHVGTPYHEGRIWLTGGKHLACFFYDIPADAKKGTVVVADVTIAEKRYSDGKKICYLDLRVKQVPRESARHVFMLETGTTFKRGWRGVVCAHQLPQAPFVAVFAKRQK